MIAEAARIVSDGLQAVINADMTEDREHQLDVPHYSRGVSYRLWEHVTEAAVELDLETRNELTAAVEELVLYLKNSVEKHRETGAIAPIKHRID